jgi:hypothetical protein
MRIRWTVPAADDLTNINNYLQKHYPQFAESGPSTNTSVRSELCPIEAGPAIAAAQESWCYHRFLALWFTE